MTCWLPSLGGALLRRRMGPNSLAGVTLEPRESGRAIRAGEGQPGWPPRSDWGWAPLPIPQLARTLGEPQSL